MLPFIQSTYLKSLLESFSSGVVIMNVRGDVYAANEAAARMLGMGCDRLLDAHLSGSILDRFQEKAEVERFLELAREGGELPGNMPVRYRHPTEGVRHFTLSVSRIVEYGKVFGIVWQLGDVTHIYELHVREKRMLEERSALQRERIESLAQLSMAIAHQIRNPLMTIGGFAGLLERKVKLDESGLEFVRSIQAGAKRLEAVVKAVTEYTASRTPTCRETDVPDLVQRTVDRLGALPSGVRLETSGGKVVWWVDPDLTGNALFELLLNAVEASAEQGGTVKVSWRDEADSGAIEVTDQGAGLAPDAVAFLFDPFFTTKAVGVGMGLSKARRWMREQGGDLTLSDGPNGGTRAVLRLPRACGLGGLPSRG